MAEQAKSIQQIRKLINVKYPKVDIFNAGGYFYLFSDDNETATFLAGLQTTSIHVHSIKQLTVDQWMTSVDLVMQNKAAYFAD